MRGARVPVLAYHAMNVAGNSYETNDHLALAHDIATLTRGGVRVVPVMQVVEAVERASFAGLEGCAAITFDDGSDFDFHDLPHPRWGLQRSMLNVLQDARARGGQPTLEASAFVIVSPQARRELDRACIAGRGWWNDTWWPVAESTGLVKIESHGWDHNHHMLPFRVSCAPRGTFDLRLWNDANAEIAQASTLLRRWRKRGGDVLFAYPYGAANAFLAHEYFPRDPSHGVRAAFTTEPGPVTQGANRWVLPRFVCGQHWRTPKQFEALLSYCMGSAAPAALPADESVADGVPFIVREVAEPGDVVEALFRKTFRAAAPRTPRHFVAVLERGGTRRVAAYLHATVQEPGVFLMGGLVVDTRVYRLLTPEEREAVSSQGSLSRWLIARTTDLLGPKRAAFAFTGNLLSQRDSLALGYQPARGPHLLVQWHDEPLASRAALVARIAAIGGF